MVTESRSVNISGAADGSEHSGISNKTEQSLTEQDQAADAAQANLAMEREFYDRDPDAGPTEAVDYPQIFRNES